MGASKRPALYRQIKNMPAAYDPGRQLVAAVAVMAVLDYLYPIKSLTDLERWSAREFLASEDAARIIDGLNIDLGKARRVIPLLPEVTP